MNHVGPSSMDAEQAQTLLERLIGEVIERPHGRAALRSMEPAQVEADYARAWALLSAGDLSAATDAFGELARRVPDQHRIQLGFALCLQHHGLVEDALRHYGLAFVLDPSSATCAFRIGECLWVRGDHSDAREAMLTAIELGSIQDHDSQIIALAQASLDEWASAAPRT
ncbi:MAG: hypothetical protein RL322_2176 [Pseudomonadota bacterium]